MSTIADLVLEVALSRPPTLGHGRLVCVDGPAGSGKTTLAAGLATLTGAQVVHVDDVLEGWSGLARVGAALDSMLRPLAAGGDGSYEHYDWAAGRFDHTVPVPSSPLLVIEGVGAGSSSYASLVTVLVWIEAPADVRLARGLARDGVEMEALWRQWQVDEAALFARERTASRADVVVDGTGARTPVVRP